MINFKNITMKTNKPFWESNENPIVGYKILPWNVVPAEFTSKYKKRLLEQCIIINDDL